MPRGIEVDIFNLPEDFEEQMTEKELCLMCENYSEDTKCEQRDNCKLMAVLNENMELKKKVSRLKQQLDESELKRSYMINPNAIGDRHDMGCW